MISLILYAVVAGIVGFIAGCFWAGTSMAENIASAEDQRDEMKRRLNRIIETERPTIEEHPELALIYAVAKGERI
ncbi:hypothetical protein [Sphingobium amiense]|uniref:hypothetical protein n=1 Tax=Sphingobium amiense TaxID=135719 RepID=UPI000831472E|nr:hypothetical protein [Sphingobium amiense]